MTTINAQKFINTENYPIHRVQTEKYAMLIDVIREQLEKVGCAVLPNFIRNECIDEFIAEADRVAENGHRSFNRTNVYFSTDDESLDPSHPVRRFYNRSNSFVPADNFKADSPLRAVL